MFSNMRIRLSCGDVLKGVLLTIATLFTPSTFTSEAHGRSLKELLNDVEVRRTYNSAQSLNQLEMCIGIELSQRTGGMPFVLHGENEFIIAVGGSGSVQYALRISEQDGMRHIEIFMPGKFKDSTASVVETCL